MLILASIKLFKELYYSLQLAKDETILEGVEDFKSSSNLFPIDPGKNKIYLYNCFTLIK